MANKYLKDGAFIEGNNPPKAAARPRMNQKPEEAPAGNAANSANPKNPGNLNVLSRISANGTFKTGHST